MKKTAPRKPGPLLEVSRLGLERDGIAILSDINWCIRKNEHWVILGANGSGKTSLLSALNAFLTPTTGDIKVFDETYGESDWRELRKRIGIVSSSIRQMIEDAEPALDIIISGQDASVNLWRRVTVADRRKASAILKKLECSHLADRRWEVLSQGERQRMLIGRALMAQPSLLILDEPCAGLDPAAREQFLGFIEHLARRKTGPSLVLVTHHVEEITPSFTHALVLGGGRVLASGPIRTTLTSRLLSTAFGTRVRLSRPAKKYQLYVDPGRSSHNVT